MIVVYKESIIEKIDEAILEASQSNKYIQKIYLLCDEWNEFTCELKQSSSMLTSSLSVGAVDYKGILIYLDD